MSQPVQIETLNVGEEDAFGLVEAAITLDQSRGDKVRLAAALEQNLQLWVAIRTLVSDAGSALPDAVKANLKRLSDFVAETTLKKGVEISDNTITTLVNVNLQISEGLLESASRA
jgi:flagellar biosynthesis regulator FlaF